MGIILELGLGLALGVVGVPVLVGHSELPSGAIVAVSRMPLALNLEVGRSCSAANNCVVDPIPPVEDDAFGLRNFWAWDRTFAVRRDVNPASSAPRFFRSECGYAGPRSPNIFECDANDLASAFRSTQVHYLRGDYPKNGSFGTNESLMRLIGVDRSTARIERGGNGRSHRDEAQSYTPSGNPCLLKGEDGHCVGGVRRTSLLYKVVCIQAVLFLGILAGFGVYRSFPVSKPFDLRWLAISAASAVAGQIFLIASITGKVWLFGI